MALASGTIALQLGLVGLGIKPGDEVVVQTTTFAASAFAVAHAGAIPVFCDIEPATWCLDPERLRELLEERATHDRLPAAVMPVDLYGRVADYAKLEAICADFAVPIIEDAAEALGSRRDERPAGGFGDAGIFSFNGNKIITTSGGGALVGPTELIEKVRYLSTQARQPVLHYEHTEIGYNARMSNLLAALGRAQLAGLDHKIERRLEINQRYRLHLTDLTWSEPAPDERPNGWLSVALLPEGINPTTFCERLAEQRIEARPTWKPMHQQPVFSDAEVVGGDVADSVFDRGVCFPSGSAMTDDQLERVIETVQTVLAEWKPV